MIDFQSPFEDWDIKMLQRYMAWKVIEGLTTGQRLDAIVYEFPMLAINWKQVQDAKKKK